MNTTLVCKDCKKTCDIVYYKAEPIICEDTARCEWCGENFLVPVEMWLLYENL